MIKKSFIIVPLLLISFFSYSQDHVVTINTSMFDRSREEIFLGTLDGWLYKSGNDTSWAQREIDLTEWESLKPSEINAGMAVSGRFEGWFRIKIKLDSSFREMKVGFRSGRWLSMDLYIDGRKLHTFGNTKELSDFEKRDFFGEPIIADLKPGQEYLIAIHLVDYVSPWHRYKLKCEVSDKADQQLIRIMGPDYMIDSVNLVQRVSNYGALWISVMGLLSMFFWLLYFQNSDQQNLLLIALYTTSGTLNLLFLIMAESLGGISFTTYSMLYYASYLFGRMNGIMMLILLVKIFNRPIQLAFVIFLILLALVSILDIFLFDQLLWIYTASAIVFVSGYFTISSWRKLTGAQWYVVVGLFNSLAFAIIYLIYYSIYKTLSFPYAYFLGTGIYLSMPVFMMIYVAARFREIISEVRHNAKLVVQLSEEKKEQAVKQQKLLEEEVNRQTIELRMSLENLQSTQSQLIQSEKMASLGELTAGIAHEIQNPLNFVNNFSDVNKELLAEMKEEMDKGNLTDAKEIANDVIANEEKINHHGKRADAIVKGMLQHSRSDSGQKEPTDINALCDEYLRLAYHGLKAKDQSFNASFHFKPDKSLPKVNVVPQDIGRVLLNLMNNAFYAVDERLRHPETSGHPDNLYKPTVTVSTKKEGNKVFVSVRDNGNGIPQNVIDKIFQPFFTTKPTGSGTGLGLSLSYDIVKAHGGTLKVETKEGEGSLFIIELPENT